jgi:hypothetical protein
MFFDTISPFDANSFATCLDKQSARQIGLAVEVVISSVNPYGAPEKMRSAEKVILFSAMDSACHFAPSVQSVDSRFCSEQGGRQFPQKSSVGGKLAAARANTDVGAMNKETLGGN